MCPMTQRFLPQTQNCILMYRFTPKHRGKYPTKKTCFQCPELPYDTQACPTGWRHAPYSTLMLLTRHALQGTLDPKPRHHLWCTYSPPQHLGKNPDEKMHPTMYKISWKYRHSHSPRMATSCSDFLQMQIHFKTPRIKSQHTNSTHITFCPQCTDMLLSTQTLLHT